MAKKEFVNGEIWKTRSSSRIIDKIQIEIIDTKNKSCCNCAGFGNDCDKGFAWIYCEIRTYFEEKFYGDCGELKGCSEFIPFYYKIANKISNKWYSELHCQIAPIFQKQELRNEIISEMKKLFPTLEKNI